MRSGRGRGRTSAARRTPASGPCSRSSRPSQIDDAWVGIVIPHELTHLVFDTAAGNPYHQPPRWLNEGLAVYESQGYDASDRGLVADAVGVGHPDPARRPGRPVPDERGRVLPGLCRERLGGRLHDPDLRQRRAGGGHPLVQGRADGRRGVPEGTGRRHGRVRGRLAGRDRGEGAHPLRAAAGAGRADPVRLADRARRRLAGGLDGRRAGPAAAERPGRRRRPDHQGGGDSALAIVALLGVVVVLVVLLVAWRVRRGAREGTGP